MSGMRRVIVPIVAGAIALSAVSGALAFHPGVGNGNNPNHDMPQGPNVIACENQGGLLNPSGKTAPGAPSGAWGVFNAIDRGGMVHCERVGE